MTSASSFQMLRGAVIIFTGLFSVAFLGRRLAPSQWVGILATIAGLVVVGLADLLSKHDSQHKLSEVITGEASWGPEAASPVLGLGHVCYGYMVGRVWGRPEDCDHSKEETDRQHDGAVCSCGSYPQTNCWFGEGQKDQLLTDAGAFVITGPQTPAGSTAVHFTTN